MKIRAAAALAFLIAIAAGAFSAASAPGTSDTMPAMTAPMAPTPPMATPVPGRNALSDDQQSQVEAIIRNYLIAHPEIVRDAIDELQRREDAATQAQQTDMIKQSAATLFDSKREVVLGNPKGDVTLVEFFDYRCPYCKQIEPSLDALIKEDGKLRVVYKEFPILGPPSVFASRAAIAARKQGKYDAFHSRMMAFKGAIDSDAVLKVATAAGLDLDRLKTDMAAPEIDKIIQRNYALAEALAIDGTPGLIVGDDLAVGAVDLDTLRKMIAAARKKGG